MKDNTKPTDRRANGVAHPETQPELDAFVSETELALVAFSTDGWGIYRSMGSVLGNPARELEAPIGTANPRDCPPIIERFDVHSVPVFVLFVDGVPVARLADGFVGADEPSARIGRHTE